MTVEIHPLPARPADGGPVQKMIAAQLAWQQLFWRLALAPWSGAWPPRPHASPVKPQSPASRDHDQLAVPPAVAADGEHALFA